MFANYLFSDIDSIGSANKLETLLIMASNATEIAFIPNCDDPPEPTMSDKVVDSVIKQCISRQKLEFLYVCTVCHLQSTFTALSAALDENKDVQREWMEVVLNVDIRTISDMEQFVQSVRDIVKTFDESKVMEWMFAMEFENCSDKQSNGDLILAALGDNTNFAGSAEVMSCTEESFVIASNDCSRERHDMWWWDEFGE